MNESIMRNKIQNKIAKVRKIIADDFNKQPTDEDLKTITRHKNYFTTFFYQYALGAIIAGFVVRPFIEFANPLYYVPAGLTISLSVIAAYRLLVVSSVSPWINRKMLAIFMCILIIITSVFCYITLIDTTTTSTKHDRYCRNIQYLIERGKDSEKNSTIFKNIQCRFQSSSW